MSSKVYPLSPFEGRVLRVITSKVVVHVQVTSKPQVIDEVDRRLIQLEMEKLSLRKETRRDALQRGEQIEREMEELTLKQVQ